MADEHWVATESSPRRVRAVFAGVTVADSKRVLLLRERGHVGVYYFPMDDVRMDLLTPTDKQTRCPYKGDASYWSIDVKGRRAENAVWAYEDPLSERVDIKGHVAFYWDKLDHWFEEDEEVFVHPRDPHHRVDACRSSRPVRVVIGGETVAASDRPVLVFETGLPVRFEEIADERRRLFPRERRAAALDQDAVGVAHRHHRYGPVRGLDLDAPQLFGVVTQLGQRLVDVADEQGQKLEAGRHVGADELHELDDARPRPARIADHHRPHLGGVDAEQCLPVALEGVV